MHFLNRIGAILLFVWTAGVSHVTTLYSVDGTFPGPAFLVVYAMLLILGFFMWLKDWRNPYLFKFKWYDK